MQGHPTVQELRRKDHEFIRAEVEKRLLQNADNLDKAVLTYSAAGLALSLGFLKDFVPISVSTAPWLLYLSWAFFVLAVFITLGSFLSSQMAQKRTLELSRIYNIEMKDSAFDLPNYAAKATEFASYAAAAIFAVALTASSLFVALNLEKGTEMTLKKTVLDGVPAPLLQKIQQSDFQKGAPVPTMQSTPQPVAPPVTSTPAPATPASGQNSNTSGSR